ncbi:hypothetical protein ACEPAF_3921 [Sanghuangporus sanghuang]
MKYLAQLAGALMAFTSQSLAHYTFPSLIVNGSSTSQWVNVRRTNNYNTRSPVTDVTSLDIRCYTSQQSGTAETITVLGGSTIGFSSDQAVYHQSTTNIYAAKAPSNVDGWAGDGAVWFKLWELPPITDGGQSISFPSEGTQNFVFTLPSSLPSGQYLLRIENIALHSASGFGGAQFYIACGQINVANGGSGTPGPLVSFPGAYTGNEPGILINIYYPVPTNYTQPGPVGWLKELFEICDYPYLLCISCLSITLVLVSPATFVLYIFAHTYLMIPDRSYRVVGDMLPPNSSDCATYRRPLGDTELGFYWDSVFNGTAITISHDELDADPDLEHDLLSELNVRKAWLRMKQRYPLLGASIDELDGSDTVEFTVDEESLQKHRPEEVCITEVDDVDGVGQITEKLLNGPSPLSKAFLARVWVVNQKDVPYRHHIFICLIHSIMDGVASNTLTREFFQELSSLSDEVKVKGGPLSERLLMLAPIEDLHPIPGMSPARRKWREATAKVILNIRLTKQVGGHTLPKKPFQENGKPAQSCTLPLFFPEDISKQIIASCRALHITFGSALPVLSQLAISRVLHKRRRRMDEKGTPLINDEEWEYRRIQPMHFGGPVNFRPYLNRDWFRHGGMNEICLAITFSYSTLPFMPSKEIAGGRDTPSFSDLLSRARFLHRSRLIQAQLETQLRSPLFHELHTVQTPRRVTLAKAVGLAWRAKQAGNANASKDVPSTYNHRFCVFTNGGATLGSRDAVLPYDYPYNVNVQYSFNISTPRPRLHIVDAKRHLRCRPSELYLGAITQRKQLMLFSCVDLNAYEEDIVKEWLEETRSAAIHYLGARNNQKARL